MPILKLLSLSVIAASLASCGTDHNNDYLTAQQGAPLKLPPRVSNYAMQDLYTLPDGAVWHSNQPVSIYPPGSSLAKTTKAATPQPAINSAVIIGMDAQGSPALNIKKPYLQVWEQLPQSLQAAGFTVAHTDQTLGIYQANQNKQSYEFIVMNTQEQNVIISIRDGQGGLLSDKDSNAIALLLKTQLQKVWS